MTDTTKRYPKRRCRFCRRWFSPGTVRQVFCGRRECYRERRRTYMRTYMTRWKSRNPDYWKTASQYAYLRRWRESHPDYFRRWRRRHRR